MTWSGNEGLAYPEKSLTLGSRSSVMLWCAAVPGTSAPSRADELRFPSAGADVRAVADAGSRCCLTGKLADFCQINCRGSLVQGFRMGLCALTRCQITCRDSNRVFATGFDAFLRRVRSILTPILSLERHMYATSVPPCMEFADQTGNVSEASSSWFRAARFPSLRLAHLCLTPLPALHCGHLADADRESPGKP